MAYSRKRTKFIRNLELDYHLRKLEASYAHYLERAISSVSVRSGLYIQHGSTRSYVKQEDAGKVIVKFVNLPKTIQKNFQPEAEKIMFDIFKESQHRVPIDKRYVGKPKDLKRAVNYSYDYGNILVIDEKTRRRISGDLAYNDSMDSSRATYTSGKKLARSDEVLGYSDAIYRTFESGIYRKEHKDFLLKYFTHGNYNKRYQVYQDPTTNKLSADSLRYGRKEKFDFGVDDIRRLDAQELKRGAVFDRKNLSITYSATDSTRPNQHFDYAQLQHDNVAYKHSPGKKALFLYDAVEGKKSKLRKALRSAVHKSLEEVAKK